MCKPRHWMDLDCMSGEARHETVENRKVTYVGLASELGKVSKLVAKRDTWP